MVDGHRPAAMPVHNADIARIFEEIADLLELSDANPFRVRAYRNAARLVGDLQLDVAATLARGQALPKLPGVGPKRVKVLYHELDVQTLPQLYKAAREAPKLAGTDLLTGIEVDILEDGALPDAALAVLDVVSDAHSALEFDNLKFGIGQARRGWLAKGDVLNTRDLASLRPLLRRKGTTRSAPAKKH